MKIVAKNEQFSKIVADFRILFVCEKKLDHRFVEDRERLDLMGFDGSDESICIVENSIYVGVENQDSESYRIAAAKAIGALKPLKISSAKVACYGEYSSAIIEGFGLGFYEFNSYKSKPKSVSLETIFVSTEEYLGNSSDLASLENIINRSDLMVKGVNLARDLINTAPNEINPITLAKKASEIAKDADLECTIYDEKYLETNGMGAMLAVGKASATQPRLIHLAYKPKNAQKKVVFVGKGLTYDTGGLSLKPSDYMTTMKADMSGAAAVMAIIKVASDLALPIEIHAIAGAAENAVSGNAFRPDDVLVAKNQKTIEVKNTDAEGRLVLADALCYAQDMVKDLDYIVDIATLTGACVVALGEYTTGVMGFDEDLKNSFVASGEKSGELAWILPFNRHLKKLLKSEVADISNISSSRYGGAITAGIFLSEFIEEKNHNKWVHLDIAGPAFVEKAWGVNPYGATGAGVRMAIEWLESLKG